MAKFLKHIGKHGDRKVAVIFREIPNEEHMCLVVYTETLNQNIHDPMMTAIESDMGQSSENLGDALNRSYTKDGKIILQVIHREGMMKKVQTNQILMTPYPNQTIRLSELNSMLNEMAKGEEAIKKMADLDSSRGLQDPKDVARRKQVKNESVAQPQGFLDNAALVNNLRTQALNMSNEAKSLLAESERLMKEADMLSGETTTAKVTKTGKTTKSKINNSVAKKTVAISNVAPAKKTRTKKVATAS